MEVEKAPDVQMMVEDIIETLNSPEFEMHTDAKQIPRAHLNQHRIICMRSTGATARAYARIWSFPKIWQVALEISTFYVIEVLSQHFDKLPQDKKEQTLMHELLHIPKTFSGALLDHHHPSAPVNQKRTMELWKEYKRKKENLKNRQFEE